MSEPKQPKSKNREPEPHQVFGQTRPAVMAKLKKLHEQIAAKKALLAAKVQGSKPN